LIDIIIDYVLYLYTLSMITFNWLYYFFLDVSLWFWTSIAIGRVGGVWFRLSHSHLRNENLSSSSYLTSFKFLYHIYLHQGILYW